MTLTGRFMQYYRENANWLERTYAFVPRVGIEQIRAVVVEDSEGIAADLDAADAEATSTPTATRGRKGAEPVTPGQFRTSLPLVVLPQVPVRSAGRAIRRSERSRLVDGTAVTARRTGHRLGPLDQIPLGEGRAFAVGGEQVAVFRLRDGGVRAVSARLPAPRRPDRRRADRRRRSCSARCT